MFWNRKPVKADIIKALAPILNIDSISGVVIQDTQVLVTLEIDPKDRVEMEKTARLGENILHDLKGIRQARIILTAEKSPDEKAPPLQPKHIQADHPENTRPVAPHVKHIIAVASGKGGVGKSTVAVNLAISLQQMGVKTGLLDADVYGPSVPMLLGLRTQKPQQENDYLMPLEAHGLKTMSMGFMVDEAAPMVWRGPMVQSALLQMLRDVQWGELDILLIDMPPGTGDTQLTIAQRVKLSGAVIVSTPQDIALLDTVKGVHMFQKVSVPILGIIENMSYFICPKCGEQSAVFGRHGAKTRAEELGVNFLGEIPLDMEVRQHSDVGTPVTLQMDHAIARMFQNIARDIWNRMQQGAGSRPAPRIVIESA